MTTTLWLGDFDWCQNLIIFQGLWSFQLEPIGSFCKFRVEVARSLNLDSSLVLISSFFLSVYFQFIFLFRLWNLVSVGGVLGASKLVVVLWKFALLFLWQNWMCCQCFDSSLVSSNSQRNCLDLMCHKDRHRKMGSSEPSFWVNPIVERVLLLLPGSLPRFSQHFWVCLLTLPYPVSQ